MVGELKAVPTVEEIVAAASDLNMGDVPVEAFEEDDLAPQHVGGPWYMVDGQKVKGKNRALEIYHNLKK